jgi:hypothetical protein
MARYSVSRVKKDLSGSTINKWSVLSKLPNGNRGRVYWECKCITCGAVKRVRDDSLKKSLFGCIDCSNKEPIGTRKPGMESPIYKGTKDISLTQWKNIKKHSVRNSRILEFTISIEFAQKLLEQQNYKCKLTGLSLVTQDKNEKYNCKKITASLDRIDSSKGYIEGNIQWVHKKVNTIKWNLEQSEFIELCGLVWGNHLASISASGHSA